MNAIETLNNAIETLNVEEMEMVSGGGVKCSVRIKCDTSGECEAEMICTVEF